MDTKPLLAVLALVALLLGSLLTVAQAQEPVVLDPPYPTCASVGCPLGTGSICCNFPQIPTAFCGPGGKPHIHCKKSLQPADPLPLPDADPVPVPDDPLPLPRR
jgi:hypothetical protein